MLSLRRARSSAIALAVGIVLLTAAAFAHADGPSFPSAGAFTLGDLTVAAASPSDTVTWWSHSWWKENALTGSAASAAFKGYVTDFSTPTPTCGGTWTAAPGNSGHPPDAVPALMEVIVSSSTTKTGSTISGNIVKIVVVATDDGYASNPGHPGTGHVVATLCGGGE